VTEAGVAADERRRREAPELQRDVAVPVEAVEVAGAGDPRELTAATPVVRSTLPSKCTVRVPPGPVATNCPSSVACRVASLRSMFWLPVSV
jgi:hypothetical protein